MEMSPKMIMLVALSFLIVSCLYSMAGFGGGSSYIAILSLAFQDFQVIRSNALLCNIAVVALGCCIAHRERELSWHKVLPYAVVSAPAAFIGAQIQLSASAFFIVLGISLILSAMALFIEKGHTPITLQSRPPILASYTGGGIGFLSGMVGIGGGIFLSPILHLFRLENAHQVTRIASFFILVNSTCGLAGLAITNTFQTTWQISALLLVCVLLGGYFGATFSAKKLNESLIKKITGILVMAAGVRLLVSCSFHL